MRFLRMKKKFIKFTIHRQELLNTLGDPEKHPKNKIKITTQSQPTRVSGTVCRQREEIFIFSTKKKCSPARAAPKHFVPNLYRRVGRWPTVGAKNSCATLAGLRRKIGAREKLNPRESDGKICEVHSHCFGQNDSSTFFGFVQSIIHLGEDIERQTSPPPVKQRQLSNKKSRLIQVLCLSETYTKPDQRHDLSNDLRRHLLF